MTISHSKPRLRLHFIVLAVLAAVGMFIAAFGAADAQAHGTCTNNVVGPSKSNGVIKGRNTFTCTNGHAVMNVSAHIEMYDDDADTWVPINEPTTRQGTGTSSPEARTAAPCMRTARYRVVGSGRTGNPDTVSPHMAQDPTGGVTFTCTASDLTNSAGLLDLVNTRLSGLAAT